MRPWLHPVSLLSASLVLTGSLIFVSRIAQLIVMIILCLLVVVSTKASMTTIGTRLLKLWPFLIITFLLHAALSGHRTADFSILPRMGLNMFGLATAGFFTARLVVILAVGIALYLAYPPQSYSRELARAVGKLPFWRTRAARLEMTIGLALQFVPFVEQEYHRFNLALAARGEPVARTVTARLARQRKLLFPLMLNAFRRADYVSLALEARGYDPDIPRTSLISSPVSALEMFIVLGFAGVCIAALWI